MLLEKHINVEGMGTFCCMWLQALQCLGSMLMPGKKLETTPASETCTSSRYDSSPNTMATVDVSHLQGCSICCSQLHSSESSLHAQQAKAGAEFDVTSIMPAFAPGICLTSACMMQCCSQHSCCCFGFLQHVQHDVVGVPMVKWPLSCESSRSSCTFIL